MRHDALGSHLENRFHGKELGSNLLRHRIKKYPDLASTRFRIHFRIQKYPLWRPYSKSSGFASEFAGYVWTDGVSGKSLGKSLRIKKYPDTCGRGLTLHFLTPQSYILFQDGTNLKRPSLTFILTPFF